MNKHKRGKHTVYQIQFREKGSIKRWSTGSFLECIPNWMRWDFTKPGGGRDTEFFNQRNQVYWATGFEGWPDIGSARVVLSLIRFFGPERWEYRIVRRQWDLVETVVEVV